MTAQPPLPSHALLSSVPARQHGALRGRDVGLVACLLDPSACSGVWKGLGLVGDWPVSS